jgi:hypothetical protein
MMTARSIVTRIERLEARRRSGDKMLLIWRKPGQDTDAAVAESRRRDCSDPVIWFCARSGTGLASYRLLGGYGAPNTI